MRVALESENGTSPRGWGEGHDDAPEIAAERNIPTRVGRRPRRRARDCGRTEHPHAGGEKKREIAVQIGSVGTSPRGWGEGDDHDGHDGDDRNIPTRVGRSDRGRAAGQGSPEHPHAGGEKRPTGIRRTDKSGTSPRGWGEGGGELRDARVERNIPTRVGRSVTSWTKWPLPSEHPHAGGEKWRRYRTDRRHDGTSPRGWGEDDLVDRPGHTGRNIPTRVGRRSGPSPMAPASTEHPHAGGEKVNPFISAE